MLTQDELNEELASEVRHGLSVEDITLADVRNWGDAFEDVTQEQIDSFLSEIGESRCRACGSDEFSLNFGICVDCDDDYDEGADEYWNGYEDCRY